MNELKNSQQVLKNEKVELTNKITDLSKEKDNLAKEKIELTEKNKALTTDKENLTTALSNAKSQVIQANQEKENLEQKHAPYKKLEKLYEVFLEVKGCLNFNFVEKTHSAMDLIAYVLSDSKYYLESLYAKASQELSDKKSDKGEKLAELFDLLFEYIKDKKFERLKEPSAYDSTCKSLYPEQNTSQKMQRVVLIGYTYDKKHHYIILSWIWDHKMGTFIEKCFGFYQVRKELEARISGLENEKAELFAENEKLAVGTSELKDANNQLRQKNDKLFTTKEKLTKANTDLENKNDKLSKENENLAVKISGLENSNDQLLQAIEKIAEENTELEREMACLKSLEATDKSDLDLQNWRFKSAIEDLKRQKQKIRRREHGAQREGLERATFKTTKIIIKGEISW